MMIVAKKLRKQDPRRGKPGTMRRCLGIGAEHSFRSPDPSAIRICNACKRKLYKDRVYFNPVEEIH